MDLNSLRTKELFDIIEQNYHQRGSEQIRAIMPILKNRQVIVPLHVVNQLTIHGINIDEIVGEPVLLNLEEQEIPLPYYSLLICGQPIHQLILANTENSSPFSQFISRKCAIAFYLLAHQMLPYRIIEYILSFKLWEGGIDCQNYFGMTPLQCAILNANHTGNYDGAISAVEELLEWGADRSIGNDNAPEPLTMVELMIDKYEEELDIIQLGSSVDFCFYTNKRVGSRNHSAAIDGLIELRSLLLKD